jgi:hypothetical protein
MNNSHNKISVALCTYNGEQFLRQQLQSIQQQSRLPDELVVCDDRSTDQTLVIARDFAATVSFPVVIVQNTENLGSSRNFQKAIGLCTGDLIALSDQDDIWYPNRLQRSEEELAAHPQAGLVFSDADIIDDQNRLQRGTLWQRLGFAGKRMRDLLAGQFVLLAKHRFVTGATMMFRANLRDRCLPVSPGWIHDEWITLVIATLAELRPIDQSLIRYRLHGAQQVGFQNKLAQRAPGNTLAEKHWGRVAESVKDLQQMVDFLSAMPPEQGQAVRRAYQQHLQFLSFRSALPAHRVTRVVPVLTHFSQYGLHASGLPSMFKDLLLKRSQ